MIRISYRADCEGDWVEGDPTAILYSDLASAEAAWAAAYRGYLVAAGRRGAGGQPEPAQWPVEGGGPPEPGQSADPVQRAQEPVAEPADPAAFVIEVDRGGGWGTRAEGALGAYGLTEAELRALLPTYCLQYPHRLLIDGEVVATAEPSRANTRRIMRRVRRA